MLVGYRDAGLCRATARNPNTQLRIQATDHRTRCGRECAGQPKAQQVGHPGTENDLRRMRVVAVAAAISAAALAYSLPRVRAQNSPTSNPVGAGAMVSTNAPIVIAEGISARALAVAPIAEPGAAPSEGSQLPPIYFTATQMPNRVMALPGAAFSGGNNASATGASVGRGASNVTQAQVLRSSGQAEAYATVAGNGTAGSLGDGGAATAAQLSLKLDSQYMRSGVAVAADGTIFIGDTRNATIRRISSATSSEQGVIRSVAGKWGPTQNVQLVEPMGLALDRAGNLYIADHGANAVIELHDATASTPGRLEMLAQVAKAADVAVTADGSRVYVAAPETGNLLRFDAATHGIITLLASSGTACRAPTGTVASGTQPGAQNSCPDGLALDGGGNIFIADSVGSRILRIDAATQKLTTAASNISAPGEIQFDADGNLFIAEQGLNRISEIKGLGQAVANVTLTPPPPPVPPMGVPCPMIAPPPPFASNTNFCAEPLSGTTPTAAFTLTNNSNAEITGIAITTIGLAPTDFVVSSTSCTTTLNAGSSCLINLGFAPTAVGPRTATLVVTYTGATIPLVSSLAGTGDDYQLVFASGQLTEISVVAGNTGTFMLLVVPDNTFTGTVTFICPGNLPAQTTCTFSPTSVNITTPGTAVPFSVGFMTTSRVPVPPPKTGSRPVLALGNPANGPGEGGGISNSRGAIFAFVIAAIALLCRFALPKRIVPVACAIALALSAAAILDGCGGGNGTGGGATGTPAGSYKMTVQATAQSAPRGVTVTLDVQ
jgi:sugar lactone lactonase YvrE